MSITIEMIIPWAELFYYVFVSIVLVIYTIKSYRKSIEKKAELTVQLFFDYKENLTNRRSLNPIYLQIYNSGNAIAKDVHLQTNNETLNNKYAIFNKNLGFIEPGNSKFLPVGSLAQFFIGNNMISLFEEDNSENIRNISIRVIYNSNKKTDINLNYDYLLSMPKVCVGTSSQESIDEKMAKSLNSIDSSLRDFVHKYKK